jgi:hypothetical protein
MSDQISTPATEPNFPNLTSAVQRACSSVVQNAHLSIPGMVIDVLQSALKDPNDPDWLARQLFILNHSVHDEWPPQRALKVWTELSPDSEIKVHYRMMADGLRMTLTGMPV